LSITSLLGEPNCILATALCGACSQALQWQLLQQEDQQQQAAVSHASCLRQIRAAGAAAMHKRQQLAGAVARQTNLFRCARVVWHRYSLSLFWELLLFLLLLAPA
jgi:hypothetical protein